MRPLVFVCLLIAGCNAASIGATEITFGGGRNEGTFGGSTDILDQESAWVALTFHPWRQIELNAEADAYADAIRELLPLPREPLEPLPEVPVGKMIPPPNIKWWQDRSFLDWLFMVVVLIIGGKEGYTQVNKQVQKRKAKKNGTNGL